MIPNILKFRNKAVYIILLLVSAQVYLVLNHIIPAYEEIPYYISRINDLKQKAFVLEITNEHFLHFQNQEKETKTNLSEFHREMNRIRDKNNLQAMLNRYYERTGLEVISQHIETQKYNSDLSLVTISLSLKGKYQKISKLLEKIATTNRFFVVSKCELVNQELLSTNPDLIMNGIVTIYLVDNI